MKMIINKLVVRISIRLVSLLLLFSACSDSTETTDLVGDWVRKSDFEGVKRSGAVSFQIGDRNFVGTGFDGTYRLKDLWEYDAARNTWYRKADFPGTARNSAVAFSANGKGYVGTGFDGTNRLNDFWEYDPINDSWKKVADFLGEFPGEARYRYGAVSLSLNNKGYVGSGYGSVAPTGGSNDLKDWWEYDPNTNIWSRKTSMGGSKRSNAFSFEISGVGYVGGGSNNGTYPKDFWSYDATKDSWTELNPLDDTDDSDYTYALQRESASTFVIGGHAYLCGGTYSAITGSVWEYDTATDLWTEKSTFEGTVRDAAVSFGVGTKGYIATGRNGSTLRFDDLWEFDPQATSEN
ncbi:MAG TPA: kelch repeat-containing protein [Cyclobacteriaceae bacterium]